jgi:hypothetical protein
LSTNDLHTIADRLAIQDVILRYFELVDSKKWDQLHEAFTEDTTARWTPESVIEGCDGLAGALRAMSGSSEIVTYHHVASMTPIVDGDTAEVTVRVRAMHHGAGPRTGKFYESLGVQPTSLVRTPDGWRIKHHDWIIVVKHGSMEELFAPELAARGRH